MKAKLPKLILILAISILLIQITTLIVQTNSAVPILWANDLVKLAVTPTVTFPTPIVNREPFEYCQLGQTAGLAEKAQAGTPIPSQPVELGTIPTEAQNRPEDINKPTSEPTTQPTSGLESWQVETVDIGNFRNNNFHLVTIGVGFTEEENRVELTKLISELQIVFAKVKIDFAYVKKPLLVDLGHIDQKVDFTNSNDYEKLLAKIRQVHPADGFILGLKTPLLLGTAVSGRRRYTIFTASDPIFGLYLEIHELGHILNLGDGYKRYYPPGYLPNSELFYLDGMPWYLSNAIGKLESIPPLYEMGTCNGRKIYTFYETSNNIMGQYNPQTPNPWGNSIFTPLQIQIMNDFIQLIKGGD